MAGISRRGVIGAPLVAAPGAALALAAPPSFDGDGRPPFHFEPVSPGHWRFRSWTWRDDAWRPLTGDVTRQGREFRVEGRPDIRDRSALQYALAGIRREDRADSAR